MTRPLPEGERTTGLVRAHDTDGPRRTVLADRYELLGVVGRGGMAEVHRAYDRSLDRVVAVKLLPGELRGDPDYTVRLRREAKAAAALSHPNAVGVFDVGIADGEVYVVLEYVEGASLRDELSDGGRRSGADAAGVGASVCDALAAAHERGIVHRDVNPGNVMRCADGTVKLMDFGIARIEGSPDRRTGTGMVLGTAAYLAPEQVRCEHLDGRTDLYALGCTLYELVTGVVPFAGDSGVEIAARRLHERPTPPRELVPTVPVGLEAVILRALERHPDDRHRDAATMAADLRDATAAHTAALGRDDARTEVLRDPQPHLTGPTGPTGPTGTDRIAPTAGESEPWSAVRRLGFVLAGCALVVLVVVAAIAMLR